MKRLFVLVNYKSATSKILSEEAAIAALVSSGNYFGNYYSDEKAKQTLFKTQSGHAFRVMLNKHDLTAAPSILCVLDVSTETV